MKNDTALNAQTNSVRFPCVMLAAGGTGGHIFPAYTLAQNLVPKHPVELLWIGTSRNREQELCNEACIPLQVLDVSGINKFFSFNTIKSLVETVKATLFMVSLVKERKPVAVVAFGGYVCAPVLAAARLCRVPYFLHEQNAYMGRVNRFFWKGARKVFLGFPLEKLDMASSKVCLCGTPIRAAKCDYSRFDYPLGIDKTKTTVLISGGSQGAKSMNTALVATVAQLSQRGCQVIWQTGVTGYEEIATAMKPHQGVFIFDSLSDLYPYYAIARAVICRAGASTLAEIAYFGLPCVLIPLPWAADNHQWINASIVESQGWGIRVKQNENTGSVVSAAVQKILTEEATFEKMSMRALDNSPIHAGIEMATIITHEVGIS